MIQLQNGGENQSQNKNKKFLKGFGFATFSKRHPSVSFCNNLKISDPCNLSKVKSSESSFKDFPPALKVSRIYRCFSAPGDLVRLYRTRRKDEEETTNLSTPMSCSTVGRDCHSIYYQEEEENDLYFDDDALNEEGELEIDYDNIIKEGGKETDYDKNIQEEEEETSMCLAKEKGQEDFYGNSKESLPTQDHNVFPFSSTPLIATSAPDKDRRNSLWFNFFPPYFDFQDSDSGLDSGVCSLGNTTWLSTNAKIYQLTSDFIWKATKGKDIREFVDLDFFFSFLSVSFLSRAPGEGTEDKCNIVSSSPSPFVLEGESQESQGRRTLNFVEYAHGSVGKLLTKLSLAHSSYFSFQNLKNFSYASTVAASPTRYSAQEGAKEAEEEQDEEVVEGEGEEEKDSCAAKRRSKNFEKSLPWRRYKRCENLIAQHQGDETKAKLHLAEIADWRVENDLDNTLNRKPRQWDILKSEFQTYLYSEFIPVGCSEKKTGYLVIEELCGVNVKKMCSNNIEPKLLGLATAFIFEYVREIIFKESYPELYPPRVREDPFELFELYFILDCKNTNYLDFISRTQLLFKLEQPKIIEKYYPGILKHVFLINFPIGTQYCLKFVEQIFPKSFTDKIILIRKPEDFEQYINLADLPEEYHGKNPMLKESSPLQLNFQNYVDSLDPFE